MFSQKAIEIQRLPAIKESVDKIMKTIEDL